MELTAFVLAGGKSTRMGADKAFLELRGKTLLQLCLDLAYSVTNDVRIVGDAAKFSQFGPVIEDIYRNCGPLAGIHAALSGSSSELNLIIAVDLPFLTPALLRFLIAEADKTNAVVTVPQIGGRLQPLCAVYRRQFSKLAERSLTSGKNKIDALFSETSTHVISEAELQAAGIAPEAFRNLNTREDLESAIRNLGERDK